jgi:hypothetical protein
VDEREAEVGPLVLQAEAKASPQRRVTDATKERVVKVQVAVTHTLGESLGPVAALLQLDQLS